MGGTPATARGERPGADTLGGVRPVIAPLAHAHAKVLPEPFGTRAPQPLIVLQQMDQGRIHVFIEQTREILPPVLRGQ